MADQKQLVHLQFDEEMLASIDDFMFSARIRTRSEAIRALIRFALEHKAEAIVAQS